MQLNALTKVLNGILTFTENGQEIAAYNGVTAIVYCVISILPSTLNIS